MSTKNETWSWFKSFFSEESGGSTTRALSWIWTGTLCFCLALVLGFTVVKAKDVKDIKLPEIPAAYITLTGLFLAAKVGQRVFGENTSTTVVTSTDATDKAPATTTTTTTPTPPNNQAG